MQLRQAGARKDRWGYSVNTCSDKCIQLVNKFYDQVLSYGVRKKIILESVEEDPNCVLANALAAWYKLPVDPTEAREYINSAKQNAQSATDYELAILAAVEALVEGRVEEALSLHSRLLEKYPLDLVSLKRAQLVCFSIGDSNKMLRLVSKVLPANVDAPYIYGMLAFSFVELGKSDEAEAAARKALSIEEEDVWAQHALCHVFQHQRKYGDAVSFMESKSDSWNTCGSFLYSHCWWHLAICHVENNSVEKALYVFDQHIWNERERGERDISQVILNALALLLYLEAKGYRDEVENRVNEVADYVIDEATWNKEWLLDLLIVWALARSSHLIESKRLLESLKTRVHTVPASDKHKNSLLALCSALYESGSGNHHAVFRNLGPSFDAIELKIIGASNDQMRVFQELWQATKQIMPKD